MTTPSLEQALNIAQVMDFTIHTKREKLAVHCHAGLGRTGLVIACYLVYKGFSFEEAIHHVRQRRYLEVNELLMNSPQYNYENPYDKKI